MTPIGYLTLFFAYLVLVAPYRLTFLILALVSTWTAATVVEFGSTIWPFELCVAAFLARSASAPGANYILSRLKETPYSALVGLFGYGFAIWCLIAPVLFEGVEVFAPRLGIDDQLNARSFLRFGPSNVAQFMYWVSHTTLLLVFMGSRGFYNVKSVIDGVRAGFVVVLILSVWQLADKYLLIGFPYGFFLNSESYSLAWNAEVLGFNRLNGTFTEASVFSGNLAAIAAFFLLDFVVSHQKISFFLYSLCLLLIAASVSTSGIMAVFFLGVVHAIIEFYRFKRGGSGFVQFVLPIAVISFGVVFFYLRFSDAFNFLVLFKVDSLSGQSRSGADIHSLDVFLQSYGLGVGFGSHRASSLLMTALGCAGLLGIIYFSVALIYSVKCIFSFSDFGKGGSAVFGGPVFVYLVIGSISIPDANVAILWFFASLSMLFLPETRHRSLIG